MTLRLVDLPLPVLTALRDDDVDSAASILGLAIPPEFAAHVEIWTFMITLLDGQPANEGWTMNAIVSGDTIVGNAGFKGAPDAGGDVELGYTVLPAHRRQGIAVAATRLLVERCIREPSVSGLFATIAPDNAASIATITVAGFAPAGDRIHERWGRQLVFRHDLVGGP